MPPLRCAAEHHLLAPSAAWRVELTAAPTRTSRCGLTAETGSATCCPWPCLDICLPPPVPTTRKLSEAAPGFAARLAICAAWRACMQTPAGRRGRSRGGGPLVWAAAAAAGLTDDKPVRVPLQLDADSDPAIAVMDDVMDRGRRCVGAAPVAKAVKAAQQDVRRALVRPTHQPGAAGLTPPARSPAGPQTRGPHRRCLRQPPCS